MTSSLVTGSAPAASLNPLLRPSAHVRRLVVVAAVVAVVLTGVGFLLRAVPLDGPLSHHLHALHRGPIGDVAEAFYRALKPEPAAAIMVVAAIVVIVATRRWQIALVFVGTVATTWGLAELLKLVVDRPRPGLTEFAHHVAEKPVDASFPSGHVAFTASLAAALIVAFWATRARIAVVVIGAGLVAAMMTSVVIVGVHYAGDAAASVFWVAGVFPVTRTLWAMAIVPWGERTVRALRSSSLTSPGR